MVVKTYKVLYDSKDNIYKYVLVDFKINDNLTLSYDKLYEGENKIRNRKVVKEIFKQWIKNFIDKQKSIEITILYNLLKDKIFDSVDELKILFKDLKLQKFYIMITGVYSLIKFNKVFDVDYKCIEDYIDKFLPIDEFLNSTDFIISNRINFNYFLKEILDTLYGYNISSCIINFKNNHTSEKLIFNKNLYYSIFNYKKI